MPYIIKRWKNGYRLVLLSDPAHYFSYHPMTYDNVIKQMKAIEIRKYYKNLKKK